MSSLRQLKRMRSWSSVDSIPKSAAWASSHRFSSSPVKDFEPPWRRPSANSSASPVFWAGSRRLPAWKINRPSTSGSPWSSRSSSEAPPSCARVGAGGRNSPSAGVSIASGELGRSWSGVGRAVTARSKANNMVGSYWSAWFESASAGSPSGAAGAVGGTSVATVRLVSVKYLAMAAWTSAAWMFA